MNRQTFLDELKGHLKVLQDEEQNDIINEYFQHIEMKMAKGMEEEEAVKDFGPVGELAAEILEAYHVKPEYEQESREKRRGKFRAGFCGARDLAEGAAASGKDGGIRAYVKKALLDIAGIGRKTGAYIRRWFKQAFRLACAPFWKVGQVFKQRGGGDEEQNRGASRHKAKGFLRGLCGLAGKMAEGAWAFLGWCCRTAWNLGIFLAAAASAFCGLAFLFLLGMLAVLCVQGYPLAGAATGCLGAVLCFASLSVLGGTFLLGKGSKRQAVRITPGIAGGNSPDEIFPDVQEEGGGKMMGR